MQVPLNAAGGRLLASANPFVDRTLFVRPPWAAVAPHALQPNDEQSSAELTHAVRIALHVCVGGVGTYAPMLSALQEGLMQL